MKADKHIRVLYDFENSADCFSGVHIDGGICYFLWDSQYNGNVKHFYTSNDGVSTCIQHELTNPFFDFVIRDGRIVSLLDKLKNECRFSSVVSATKPFGVRKYLFNEPERYPESHLNESPFYHSVKIYGVKGLKGGARRQIGYVTKQTITQGFDILDKYKIFFTTSYSTNAINPPESILATPNEACTETFLVIGPFATRTEMNNCHSYMQTNFFKVLLYFGKGTMQVTKSVFSLIPLQDFSHPWTDEMLYEKYGLTEDEIAFIESMIKPME